MIQPLASPRGYRIKESYRVRYEEIDAQGIVNHAQYANYLTGARVAYFRAMGFEPIDLTGNPVQLAVVHLGVDFRLPARFDDHLDVWCRVAKIGETSLSFEYQIVSGATQEVHAVAQTVLVAISLDGLAKVRVPDDLRRRVERLEKW